MFKKNMIGNVACPLSDVKSGGLVSLKWQTFLRRGGVERRWSDTEEKRLEGAGELNG